MLLAIEYIYIRTYVHIHILYTHHIQLYNIHYLQLYPHYVTTKWLKQNQRTISR